MTTDPNPKGSSTDAQGTKTYSVRSQLFQLGSGALSSAITRCVCQPFEVLKIRFQLQVEPLSTGSAKKSKYTSYLQACRVIYAEEGLLAFWKGHNAGQLLSIVYGMTQFWAFEQIFLHFTQVSITQDRPNLNRFISGGASGAVATVVSMPFDVIRTRLVSQDKGSGYRNATAAVPHILRSEGIVGLYRGLGPSLIQIGPLVGSNFAVYGAFNDLAANFLQVKHKDLPTWFILFSGGSSGVISKALVYPLDIIKRRLQVQGFHEHRRTFGKNLVCDGIFSCIHITYSDEGFFGFYKGMGPTLVKAAVSTALYFGIYEKLKTWAF